MSGMENNIYRDLASKIEAVMLEKGIKRTELASKMGVNDSFMTKFFNYGKKISLERLFQMVEILGLEIDISEKKTTLNPA